MVFYPFNLSSNGGVIQEGTTNVTVKCSCTAKTGVRLRKSKWVFSKQRNLPQVKRNDDALPYYIFEDEELVSTLVIPVFRFTFSGEYICRNKNVMSSTNLFLPKKPGKPYMYI